MLGCKLWTDDPCLTRPQEPNLNFLLRANYIGRLNCISSSGPWNLFKKRNCFRHSKEENVLHKQIINNLLLINKTLQIQLYVPCPIFIFLFPSPKVTTALTIQNNYIYVNSIIMSLFFSCRHMYILKMDL